MCFTIHRKTKPRMYTAKEDILVYKVINKTGWGWVYSLNIKGRSCTWQKGYHYTETNFVKCLIAGYYIPWRVEGDAFHSKKTRALALQICADDEQIVKMYIPAGARYYKNKEEYVSSDLVWYK